MFLYNILYNILFFLVKVLKYVVLTIIYVLPDCLTVTVHNKKLIKKKIHNVWKYIKLSSCFEM
jgi:hypothetical protein